jgi:hypothetical protein
MSALTNSSASSAAIGLSLPSPSVPPEDIELPPSPQDEEHEILGSPSPRSSPMKSTETVPRFGQYLNTTPSRPRAASPSRRMRPLSVGGYSTAPPMQRAHSSPGVDASGRYVTPYGSSRRPSSPLHSGRRRSPHRTTMEEPHPSKSTWGGLMIEPNIPEDEALDLSNDAEYPQPSPISLFSNTFPRSRRRGQPLHQSASAPSLYARAVSPNVSGRTSPSPSFSYQKYTNEPYPMYSYSSASSMPSTPTSLRSRSPSISSLDTIEDAPGAEEAAIMEEDSKTRGEDDLGDLRRRSPLEVRGSNLRSNKERKRWSVCGAERRADFSLEPIEE